MKLYEKKILCATVLALGMTSYAFAQNGKTSVGQVTNSVAVTTNTDYIITGDTPFTTAGSVDIQNTEHAVVIIKKVRPSVVIKQWMDHIFINGQKAVNGSNCQVKMYDRGAIVFPYGNDFAPLTCYTEPDFGGEACNTYREGHTGGYMNTLKDENLNNRIRSFKLKRGYMVTFALGTSGWGYSRCFIADQNDLEIANMPANMDARVSSYRIFPWYNAHKAGLASNGNLEHNIKVGSSWCYDWAQGNESTLPDVEWVPNHIYEDWPSSATCGSRTGSCHMKTNNEPGNNSDDHPQSVDEILNNWQNLMRTGMRLCSESSHDGSWSHFGAFIDSIDARGWRCDLLDLHCYWGQSSFGDFSNYYNRYGGRPVWISEWVWGASWNAGNWSSGGIFAQAPDGKNEYTTANQQKCYDGTVPILQKLNASPYVERYAYWNSEANASKILKDGELSILGQYYANMDEGLGYNEKIQKIPNVVYTAASGLKATYQKAYDSVVLSWTDTNGDMVDSIVVEKKSDGESNFAWAGNAEPKDLSGKSVSYSLKIPAEFGEVVYRVAVYPVGKKTPLYSSVAKFSKPKANGNGVWQFGTISKPKSSESVSVTFSPAYDAVPAVLTGLMSYENKNVFASTLLSGSSAVRKDGIDYATMNWLSQPTTDTEFAESESVPFLAVPEGNYKYGDKTIDVGVVTAKDTTSVQFSTPFPEGVTPVVIATVDKAALNSRPVTHKVFDVTNTGFKLVLQYEEATGKKVTMNHKVAYLAAMPGVTCIDENGIYLAAGTGGNAVYSIARAEYFTTQTVLGDGSERTDTLLLDEPLVFGDFQTAKCSTPVLLKQTSSIFRYATDPETGDRVQYTQGVRVQRLVDKSVKNDDSKATADTMGWIAIQVSEPNNATAINKTFVDFKKSVINIVDGRITVNGLSDYDVYSIDGRKIGKEEILPKGVYIVKAQGQSLKVAVK